MIEITNNDLQRIVTEAVRMLTERHVIKAPTQEPPMPPMDEEPTQEPPQEPPMSPMDEEPIPQETEQGGGEVNQELIDIISQLGLEDQNAVLKYAKSMTDKNEPQGEEAQEQEPKGGDMPMESRKYLKQRVDEIMGSICTDNTRTDNSKDVDKKAFSKRRHNPFVVSR